MNKSPGHFWIILLLLINTCTTCDIYLGIAEIHEQVILKPVPSIRQGF